MPEGIAEDFPRVLANRRSDCRGWKKKERKVGKIRERLANDWEISAIPRRRNRSRPERTLSRLCPFFIHHSSESGVRVENGKSSEIRRWNESENLGKLDDRRVWKKAEVARRPGREKEEEKREESKRVADLSI